MTIRDTDFQLAQRVQQVAHFDEIYADRERYRASAYRFTPMQRHINLAPSIQDIAARYFADNGIAWHLHANHALSSQVCCLNFLMPLAEQPDRLSELVSIALGMPPPEMLPIESDPDGRPWFVGFEWNGGGRDYLNEAAANGILKRGANSTSADAVLRFLHRGMRETLLLEWKYTERYRTPISESGNAKRIRRYGDITFAPNGPIRADLGFLLTDFFWEPFYQLLRQQLLAFQLQRAGADGAARVRVLHISPRGNRALHRVTAPALQQFGDDAFAVFRSLLAESTDFVSRSTEDIFGPLIAALPPDDAWASYLRRRYRFLSDPSKSDGNA